MCSFSKSLAVLSAGQVKKARIFLCPLYTNLSDFYYTLYHRGTKKKKDVKARWNKFVVTLERWWEITDCNCFSANLQEPVSTDLTSAGWKPMRQPATVTLHFSQPHHSQLCYLHQDHTISKEGVAQLFSSFVLLIILGKWGIRQSAMLLCREEQYLGKVHHCPVSYTPDFPLETFPFWL